MAKYGARDAALKVMREIRNGAWVEEALDREIEAAGLSGADAGLCTQICCGVLQNRIGLDYMIAACSSLKMNKIAPKVLDILRIGAYQILYLDKIPVSAAVNESVRMAKTRDNPRAGGFVNAVLRKIAEKPEIPLPENAAERLSILTSHPKELVELYLSYYDADTAKALLESNNAPAPTVFRLNTLKGAPEEILREMHSEGLDAEPIPGLPAAVTVRKAGKLSEYQSFRKGLFTVQDTASQLCAMAVGANPGEEVLDLCAAPGGKSFAMAAAMENRGGIVSCDLYADRLTYIDEGAERLGVKIIRSMPADGCAFIDRFRDRFDRVLADVPCSGFGVIRKKPDIRYKDLEDVRALPSIQAQILHNASLYVRPGGTLVYSTCTVMPPENEEIVRAFLGTHEEYTLEPFELPIIGKCDGMRTLLPTTDGTDGFFIAKMKRAEKH